jgi:hypothetical protein
MNRRTVLSRIALFSVATVVPSTWVMGCEDDSESGSNGDCTDGIAVRYMPRFNTAGVDHDHSEMTLDADELEAALEAAQGPNEVYRVSVLGSGGGDGDHQHVVDLSIKNMESVLNGVRVAKSTVKPTEPTEDDHTHVVFIAC